MITVVHGPGADPTRRGLEEPAPGRLPELERRLARWAADLGVALRTVTAGSEEALVGALRGVRGGDGVVVTAGALAFDSRALADALAAAAVPAVDLHLEDLCRTGRDPASSLLARAGARTLHGRGVDGYRWGLAHLAWSRAWPAEVVRYGPGRDHVADLRVPPGPGPHPVALLLHGGFWLEPWQRDLLDGPAVDLAGRGWATLNVEYRRTGTGGGWPATLEDVRAAARTLPDLARRRGLDLDRLVVLGHSAGAYLALRLTGAADRPRPRRAVALAPVTDAEAARAEGLGGGAVAAFLAGAPAGVAAGPPRLPLGVPQLVVHCADDGLVPVAHGRRWVAAARAAGDDVTHAEPEHGGHFAPVTPGTEAWAPVAAAC